MDLKNINEEQPELYKDVLFLCDSGKWLVGMYLGNNLPKGHRLYGKSRRVFGKFGRYCEPAIDGYRVLKWCYLPNVK